MQEQQEINLLSKTIVKLLARYNCYSYTEKFNDLIITKEQVPKKDKQNRLSIINQVLFGILTILLLTFILITGRYILLALGLFFIIFKYYEDKSIANDVFQFGNNSIKILEDSIEIIDYNNKKQCLSPDEIDEMEISLSTDELPFLGSIWLRGNSIEDTLLIELLSDNKKYLEDDLKLLTEFINKKLF